MDFLTKETKQKLIENGRLSCERRKDDNYETLGDIDHLPVVKLHMNNHRAKWLLTEIDPEDLEIAFGLGDMGVGFPELGSVFLPELAEDVVVQGITLRVSADEQFVAIKTISQYAEAAYVAREIVA